MAVVHRFEEDSHRANRIDEMAQVNPTAAAMMMATNGS